MLWGKAMLNKALLLVSGKKKVPTFTLDLTNLSPDYFAGGMLNFDNNYQTLQAGKVYSIENTRLDYVDTAGTSTVDMPYEAKRLLVTTNINSFTESAGSGGFFTFYFAPLDITKDAYVKVTYPEGYVGGG